MEEYAVYLDDGGHPVDRPYVVAAGFLSRKQKWLDFEQPWKSCLRKHNLGDVFHMTDFEREHKKDPNKWDILNELIDLIEQHTEVHFFTAVEMRDYRKVASVYALEQCMGTPFGICSRTIAKNLNLWRLRLCKPDDRLLTFVEDGTLHRGDMEECFRRDGLAIPVPVAKSTPAVQPADMLAWEGINALRTNYPRKTFKRLVKSGVWLDKKHPLHSIWRESNLTQGCIDAKVPKLSDIEPNTDIVFASAPKRKRRRTIK